MEKEVKKKYVVIEKEIKKEYVAIKKDMVALPSGALVLARRRGGNDETFSECWLRRDEGRSWTRESGRYGNNRHTHQ